MICRCGPRGSTRVFAADAVGMRVQSKRSDPTGTLPLQKRFQRELVSRWDTLRRTVPNFVATRTDLATTIGHAAITGQDPVRAFQKWFDTALKMVVVGDGRWMARFVREAGDAALMRSSVSRVSDAGFDEDKHPRDKDGKWTISNEAGKEYKVSVVKTDSHWFYHAHDNGKQAAEAAMTSPERRGDKPPYVGQIVVEKEHRGKGLANALYNAIEKHQNVKLTQAPEWRTKAGEALWKKRQRLTKDAAPLAPRDRVPPLQTLAHTELQGIAEAVSQQAVRAYANGLLTRQTPSEIGRQVQAIIDKVGKLRANMLVSFIIVRTFSAVTLDAYRAAGISRVGLVPERIQMPKALMRDAKKGSKKKSFAEPDDLVEVLTAGDDEVCQACQDISEDGPYTLDQAENLIPAHPHCRCAFIPWDDDRFASVRDSKVNVWDEFHPDQPRDFHGRWAETGDSTHAQDLLALHHTGEETMADVERHITPKQRLAIAEAEHALAGEKPTNVTMLGPDGKYTPERSKLHADILGKMFTPEQVKNALPPEGQRPVLTITGGRPASGKTTTLKDELASVSNKSFYISADEIQEHLPGYDGKKAGIFNGEAQDIAIQAENIARARRMNVTYDATLKSQTPAIERVKQYQHDGYEVHGYFVHTSPVTSAVRTVERFMRSGRYVPPAISFNSRTNEKTFDALTPMLDKWAIFDNNGAKPKLIARGKKH